MAIKIENLALNCRVQTKGDGFVAFCEALRDMRVGQSFVVPFISSNMRNAIGAAKTLLRADYITRNEEGGVRVGRIS